MKMNKLVLLVMALSTLSVFAATPQVKNVKAFQQYPWGRVYITYEVVGDIVASLGNSEVLPFLVIAAKDKMTGQTYAEALESYLSGDTGTAPGVHKVVWDICAQGVTINSDKVAFIVQYYDEYLVIDLSAGANATSYPVTYLVGAPAGGWTDDYKTNKLVLRRIPAGTFKMQNESKVTLTRSFYMGVFEVTQKQYQLVTGANPSYFRGDMLPVEKVSYDIIRGSSIGAKWPSSSAVNSSSFMGKLRARTGIDFDLPTEAQWEYACRAGTTTTYGYGNAANGNYMWYKDNSSSKTHPVGLKSANPWGLYDMHGNVSEWCLDWSGTLTYGTDPKGPSSGLRRVLRGGCWDSSASAGFCTSDGSDSLGPSYGYERDGFRIIRTL